MQKRCCYVQTLTSWGSGLLAGPLWQKGVFIFLSFTAQHTELIHDLTIMEALTSRWPQVDIHVWGEGGLWKDWHLPDPDKAASDGADDTAHLDALNHPDDWFEFSTLHLDSWHSIMELWDSPGFSVLGSKLRFTFLLGCPYLWLHTLSSVCQTSCTGPQTLVLWVLGYASGPLSHFVFNPHNFYDADITKKGKASKGHPPPVKKPPSLNEYLTYV